MICFELNDKWGLIDRAGAETISLKYLSFSVVLTLLNYYEARSTVVERGFNYYEARSTMYERAFNYYEVPSTMEERNFHYYEARSTI